LKEEERIRKRGGDLEKSLILFWKILQEERNEKEEILKEIRKKEEIGRTIVLRNSHRALLLLGTLGSGAGNRKDS
jgi:hypothetical protein